jgi:dihydropteroate synthase
VSEDTIFPKNRTLILHDRVLNFSQTLIMGIVNYTFDSFHKASRSASIDEVMHHVEKMLIEKVDIIDLGAFSTRPNNTAVSVEDEKRSIETAVEAILKEFPSTVVSIDTFRSDVAKVGIDAGAHIVNDISGGKFDPKMFETVSKLNAPYILMHIRGTYETMHQPYIYKNIASEVISELLTQIELAKKTGIEQIIIDPGFGFSKNIDQNFELFSNLDQIQKLGYPLLVGVSRKSMIYKTFGTTSEEALNGTTVLNTIALQNGANILRVHDVKEAVEARELVSILNKTKSSTD